MVTSIDGHLLVDRWTEPTAGIEADMLAEYYDEIAARFHADGWIASRKSMQYFARGRTRIPGTVEGNLRGVYIGNRKGRDVAVAVDPRGALHYGQTTPRAITSSRSLVNRFPMRIWPNLRKDGVSYLFAGAKGTDMNRALEILGESFGITTLLLEGGGITTGLLLKEQLIDEISLLIYPAIDGLSGIPSILNASGSLMNNPQLVNRFGILPRKH